MFKEHKYPGVPNVNLNIIDNLPFKIGNDTIIPIHLLHYKMPILGFRINDFAYLTDFTSISDEELSKLKNLKVLFIGALRIKEHISHLNLSQAVDMAQKIDAEKTYFIHMAHTIGKHKNVNDILPPNIRLSYDGLTIDF